MCLVLKIGEQSLVLQPVVVGEDKMITKLILTTTDQEELTEIGGDSDWFIGLTGSQYLVGDSA